MHSTRTRKYLFFSVGIQKVICSYFNIQTELRVPSIAGEVSHLTVCGHWNQNNAFTKSWKSLSATAALLVRNLFLSEHDIFKVTVYKCKQSLHFKLLVTQIISENFFLSTEGHYIPGWHCVHATTSFMFRCFRFCVLWLVLTIKHSPCFLKKCLRRRRKYIVFLNKSLNSFDTFRYHWSLNNL